MKKSNQKVRAKIDLLHNTVYSLNNSKIFAGVIMLMMNIGSRYIQVKFSKSQEAFMRNYVVREVLIFAVCWMATRDLYLSVILTVGFFIVSEHLFNEESGFCVLPDKYRKFHMSDLDTDGDGEVSQKEINDAVEVLKKAKEHKATKEKDKLLQQQLDQTKVEKSRAVSFQEGERLRQEIERLTHAINKITEIDRYAREYESSERSRQDNNRDFNPALNIMFNVYVDGIKEKLRKDEAVMFNKDGNLATVRIPKRNNEAIDRLKANIAKINGEMDKLKNKLLDTTKTATKGRYDLLNRSKFSQLEKDLGKAKKDLREEVRGASNGKRFFVPLTKIGRHAESALAFSEDYFEGPNESLLNVDENIEVLLYLLFGKRKDIEFEGQRLKILSLKWRKSEYAPFGYQTSRGRVEMRAFFNEVNLDNLVAKDVVDESSPPVRATGLTPSGEDEEAEFSGLAVQGAEEEGQAATAEDVLNKGAEEVTNEAATKDMAATRMAETVLSKNEDFLRKVKFQEARIEAIYSSTSMSTTTTTTTTTTTSTSVMKGGTLGDRALAAIESGITSMDRLTERAVQTYGPIVQQNVQTIADSGIYSAKKLVKTAKKAAKKAKKTIKSLMGGVNKREALRSAIASYTHSFNGLRLIRNFGNYVLNSDPEGGIDVNLTNHARFRRSAGTYFKFQWMYQKYIYEYMAYRFSIYHNFFRKNVWSLYGAVPYFIYEKRNSILLRDLVPYSAERELRDSTVQLVNLWNQREISDSLKLAKSLYETQMMYLNRLKLDLLRRLDLFRPAINYAILKALLKEVKRCSQKDKVKDCITRAQKILFTDYGDRSNYTFRYESAEPDWNGSSDFPCKGDTKVDVPPLWAINLREYKVQGKAVPIKVNGITLPENNFVLNDTVIADMDMAGLELDYPVAVEKLEKTLEAYKKNRQIQQAVTLNHMLPDMCLCMYEKGKLLQQKRCYQNMRDIYEDWQKQASDVQRQHTEIKNHFNQRASCYTQLAQTGEDNVECTANVNMCFTMVEPLVPKLIEQIMVPHEHAFANFYESKYPEYYRDFETLHKNYQTFFKKYQEVFASMVGALALITEADSSYERTVSQMDYLGEAYTLLLDVKFPMKQVQDPWPEQAEEDIRDYPAVVESLATFCDLLENNAVRGYVANTFPIEPAAYIEGSEDEVLEQTRLLRIVEQYSDTNPSYKTDAERRAKRLEFTEAYSKLDPAFILLRNKVDNLTADHMFQLFENAKRHCIEGQYVKATRACLLVFSFPPHILNPDQTFFNEVKEFLRRLLSLTGKGKGYVYDLITYINHPSTASMQTEIMKRLKTDKKKLPNLIYEDLGGFKSAQQVYAHAVAKKFVYIDKSKEFYKNARVVFLCLQLYLERWPTFKVFNDGHLTKADFVRILPFFPEMRHAVQKTHPGRLILSSVQNAMLHVDAKKTYEYVADFIVKYRFKKRAALRDITPISKKKQVKEALGPIMADIEKGLKKLNYIAEVIESSKYEKEDMFPPAGVYSTFMPWAVTKPYVDGNYTINIKVDVYLTSQDLRNLDMLDCDDKYSAASALWHSFFST